MKQVSSGVIAHCRFANLGVDHRIHLISDSNGLLGNYFMRAHALNRVIASDHVGNHGVVVVRVKASTIADLTASLGIERRVIADGVAYFSRLKLLWPLP